MFLLRQRSVLVLVGATVALNGTFFLLVPVFPVHSTTTLGLSAVAAGLVLAVRQFSQNAPMVLGGALADRFSHRSTMLVGLLARAGGFVGLGYATDLPGLTLSAAVVGLGGSCFDAACRAALVRIVPQRERVNAFALLSMAFVLGSLVGPLAGSALYAHGFAAVCIVGAISLAISGLAVALLVPPTNEPAYAIPPIGRILATAFADRPFLRFSIVSSGMWYLGSVLYVALPLQILALTGRPDDIGVVFSLYAAMLLVLQYPVTRFTGPRMSARVRLASGLLATGAGFLLAGLMGGLVGLMLCLVLIAFGRMLSEPTFSEIVADLSPPRSVATYAGLGYLGLGIGGGLGNLSGGALFDLAAELNALWVPWIVCGILGLGLALVFRSLEFNTHRTVLQGVPQKSA